MFIGELKHTVAPNYNTSAGLISYLAYPRFRMCCQLYCAYQIDDDTVAPPGGGDLCGGILV